MPLRLLSLLLLNMLCVLAPAASVSETTSEIGNEISRAAEHTLQALERQDPRNLSPGEMAAWLVIGCAVGAVAGRLTSTPRAWCGRMLLGLAGAFVGGVLVDLFNLDFQWGVLVLHYEHAAAALLVSLGAVYGGRLLAKRRTPTPGTTAKTAR